jgi:hypothetical protein
VAEADLDPDLKVHFDARCGLSKPFEGDSRLGVIEPAIAADLARVGGR